MGEERGIIGGEMREKEFSAMKKQEKNSENNCIWSQFGHRAGCDGYGNVT